MTQEACWDELEGPAGACIGKVGLEVACRPAFLNWTNPETQNFTSVLHNDSQPQCCGKG